MNKIRVELPRRRVGQLKPTPLSLETEERVRETLSQINGRKPKPKTKRQRRKEKEVREWEKKHRFH